ncbi:ASCH domain-containing protein [Leptolyngbya sp. FACHB-711]|uniref:ASCH domain-containing protein n=1 Tax=unclassified Leptolyngbya TaxID=2650499 RepID=UPI0016892A8D|nr:ASCH domain-containing protein [Leptolyngbya sp. FACHB-711]MBD1849902.1 ASCH domain-containing protein [Cyanobacteria bacterium FACHB-502]MBD2028289.1 ASCH domain-containing protein [Leptolyngbya sp. FACHB-711]
MKIITLHQPWASLIALGLKKYETRHWLTDYRGELLIHAAKTKATVETMAVFWNALVLGGVDRSQFFTLESSREAGWNVHPLDPQNTYGQIIATSQLADCLKMTNRFINEQTELERSVGFWEVGRFALRLDDVRPLPNPIPFKSRQGKLLDAPREIIEQVGRTV